MGKESKYLRSRADVDKVAKDIAKKTENFGTPSADAYAKTAKKRAEEWAKSLKV